MKKRFYLLGMLVAGLTFTGCTDDIDDATGGNNQNAVLEGYVKVAINLPTTSGQNTRAENDQFNNGTANEYKVGENNIIAFFEGTDETNATFGAAYSLTPNFGNVNNDPSNITTTSDNVIMKAPAKTKADNTLYALVILNANASVSLSLDGTLKIGGSEVQDFEDLTIALANQEVSTFIGSNKDAFMMTNAPMAKVRGSDSQLSTSQDVTTLVPVTIYPSEADAQAAAQADQIYVERAVAKVTVSAFPSELTTIDEGNVLSKAQVELKGWVLDNTNTSLKVVRDVEDQTNGWNSWTSLVNTSNVSENRFFGTTSPFRVYWGIDGNYGTGETKGLNNVTSLTVDNTWNTKIKDEDSKPIASYCFENTFSGSNEAAATRVIFAYTVTPNIKEDGTSVGADGDAATDFILFGKSSAVYTKTTFLAWCNEYMNDLLPKTVDAYTLNTDALNIGKTFDDEADLYGTNGLFSAGVDESNAASVLAKLQEVKFYKDNVMYAGSAYIKHFGEYYTPNLGTNTDGSLLGRYGVLRNNWYELNVTKVGIGSPDIPDDGGNLDEDESYINVEINILSWAKRQQDVEL